MKGIRDLITGRRPITGRDVWWGIFGFFAVIFAANGLMVWLALATFTGVETENAYQKGRNFNQVLEAARRQQALGWQVAIERQPLMTGRGQQVTARYRDADGRPLNGLDIVGTFRSPVQADADRTAAFTSVGTGIYRGQFELPRPGRWELRLRARDEQGRTVTTRQRIYIAP